MSGTISILIKGKDYHNVLNSENRNIYISKYEQKYITIKNKKNKIIGNTYIFRKKLKDV